MLRLVRFIHALRTLVYSIMATLRSLVWALVLMLMIFYGFGVAFTQAVSDHCGPLLSRFDLEDGMYAAYGCEDLRLSTFWGTLPRSMFTLLKAITGGISWHDLVAPLEGVN